MRYFMVSAKCGHVGKGSYYKGNFFIEAESGKEAAKKVRYYPRVKHDHKDAILSVTELDYLNFLIGRVLEQKEPYYRCHSKQEQAVYWDRISKNVYADPHQENICRRRERHQHSLNKTLNDDPLYEHLKNYRGTI